MCGFPKERREKFYQNFLGIFPDFFLSIFLFFFFSLKNFLQYLISFTENVGGGGCIYRGSQENRRLRDGVLVHHRIASHFCHLIKLFCLFIGFWSDLCVAVWRPFWVPFSSKFIFLERSKCLVSIGSDLARFEATVIKIRMEVMQCRKFCDVFP